MKWLKKGGELSIDLQAPLSLLNEEPPALCVKFEAFPICAYGIEFEGHPRCR